MSPFIEENRFKEWNDAAEYLIGLKKEANVDIVSSLEDIDRLENGKANTVRDYIQKEAWKHEVGGALIGGGLGAGAGYLDQVHRGGDSRDKVISAATAGGFGALTGGLGGSLIKNMGKLRNKHKDIANARNDIDKAWVELRQPALKTKYTDAINNVTDSLSDSTESLQAPFRQDNKLYGIRNDFHGALDNSLNGAESLVRRGKMKVKAANIPTEGIGFGRKILNHAKSFAGDVGGGAAFGAGAGVFRANGHPGYEGETGADVAKRYAGNIVGGAATGAMFGGAKKLMQLGMSPSKVAHIRDRLIDGVVNTAAGGVVGGLTGALANPEDRMQGALNGAGKGALIGGIAGTIADHPKVQGNAYRIFSGVRGVGPMAAGAYRSKEKTAEEDPISGMGATAGAIAGFGTHQLIDNKLEKGHDKVLDRFNKVYNRLATSTNYSKDRMDRVNGLRKQFSGNMLKNQGNSIKGLLGLTAGGAANKTASVGNTVRYLGYHGLSGAIMGGTAGAAANPEDRSGGALRGAGAGAVVNTALSGLKIPVSMAKWNTWKSSPVTMAKWNTWKSSPTVRVKERLLSGAELGIDTGRTLAPIAAGAYRSKEKTALNLRSLGVPLATGALGAGVGALSADEGHRLEGAAYGGAGGAALGGLARLGMAKKVPGKAPVPAVQGAQPRQLAQTATAPLAQEAQIKQHLNIMPDAPAAPNSPIHPMDNRFADVPLKSNNAPVGQYAKEAPPAKPPLDAGWTELAENPLATEVGKNFGPGKDTLSGVYPMNSGGVTKAQSIQAQRMRPEALGPVRGAGDDRIFPPERLKNQALELKGIKLAAAMGGVSSALGKATSFARGAMNNQYVRNGIVGAGMAGATGGDPKIGLGLGLGGTALNRAMSRNTGMANLTSRVPNVTKQLPAPPQPMNAPINISPGVQLMR